MKIFYFLLTIAFCSLASTCDFNDNRLRIKNNSSNSIAIDYSVDTLLEKRSNDNIPFFIRDGIMPGETSQRNKPGSTKSWSFMLYKSPNKKLNIFVIKIDTLKKYGDWDFIRINHLYERYSYTEGELNQMNCFINYP